MLQLACQALLSWLALIDEDGWLVGWVKTVGHARNMPASSILVSCAPLEVSFSFFFFESESLSSV